MKKTKVRNSKHRWLLCGILFLDILLVMTAAVQCVRAETENTAEEEEAGVTQSDKDEDIKESTAESENDASEESEEDNENENEDENKDKNEDNECCKEEWISFDEEFQEKWYGGRITFDFSIECEKLMAESMTLSGSFLSYQVGEIEIISVDDKRFKVEISIPDGEVVSDYLEISCVNEEGKELLKQTPFLIQMDTAPPEISDIQLRKLTGSKASDTIKWGDKFEVTARITDHAGSGVKEKTVRFIMDGMEKNALPKEGNLFSQTFIAGEEVKGLESRVILLRGIDAADRVGNQAQIRKDVKAPFVFYEDIEKGISQVRLYSEGDDPGTVKDGERVYLSFQTTHPVQMNTGWISVAKPADIIWTMVNERAEEGDANTYKHQGYVLAEGNTNADLNELVFSVELKDRADNSSYLLEEAKSVPVIYYAPIHIKSMRMYSDNKKQPYALAKNDDTVILEFVTNHKVTIKDAHAGSAKAEVIRGDDEYVYILSCAVGEDTVADGAYFTFYAILEDAAGNQPYQICENVENLEQRVRYMAPLEAEWFYCGGHFDEGDAEGQIGFMKNGGLVEIEGHVNHTAELKKAVILGKEAECTVTGQRFDIVYGLAQEESTIEEGVVKVSMLWEDEAGNVLLQMRERDHDQKSLLYDRTEPEVTIYPSTISFFTREITYQVLYEDANLDTETLSLLVNGEELIGEREKVRAGTQSYFHEITLNMEGEYSICAETIDMAGNMPSKSAAANITIDRTNPEISSLSLDLSKAQVFKKGIRLSDYISVEDEHLSEVVCTIQREGMLLDWNMDTEFEDEGKHTVMLFAVDMAENPSQVFIFDLYIDGTPPNPVIWEKSNKVPVQQETVDMNFTESTAFEIYLEAVHIKGISRPDQFQMLRVCDESGNEIADLLDEQGEERETYTFVPREPGSYVLYIEAVDEAGNETGMLRYFIELKERGLLGGLLHSVIERNEEIQYVSPELILTVPAGAIAVLLICSGILFWRIKRRQPK